MTDREEVVKEALRWLGTPYHPHARVLGAGVDCANLPAAVYHACGLIPDIRPKYSKQWHMHHDAELYLEWVRPYAREIEPLAAHEGDFLIWQWGRTFSHGAILISDCNVVHARESAGVVISNWRQDSELNNRPVKAFTLWDDDDVQ